MKQIWLLLSAVVLLLSGCGGGGGGTGGGSTSRTITGTIIEVGTGGPPNPGATVQLDSNTTTSDTGDGTFTIEAGSGSGEILVVYTPITASPVTFRYAFAAGSDDLDLGTLYVGPEKATVTGKVVNQADASGIPNATVTLAGHETTTSISGSFSIADVAYNSSLPGTFLGLEGRVSATGFFNTLFSPPSLPAAGAADVGNISLTADSGVTPPDNPYTIYGTITPPADADGTVVQLYQGATLVRQVRVGSSQQYGFWVDPGTYTLKFNNPTNGKSAPDQSVTLNTTSDQVRRDAALQ
ncbi:MAG: hypothetical protein JST40_00105 [Armatimonadetes bacterium]|nr:hypothetical protein [Armatimonadota bacterium]